jgi:hypothetical protein
MMAPLVIIPTLLGFFSGVQHFARKASPQFAKRASPQVQNSTQGFRVGKALAAVC